jgi:hypothetical protein
LSDWSPNVIKVASPQYEFKSSGSGDYTPNMYWTTNGTTATYSNAAALTSDRE